MSGSPLEPVKSMAVMSEISRPCVMYCVGKEKSNEKVRPSV